MLEELLQPKSIAVIGASRTPGKVGYEVLSNLLNAGFEGTLVPVNPSADEVLGLRCYKDLKSAGIPIDMGVIAVPTPYVHDAVRSVIDAGAKAVVVLTAGFREVGDEGRALEDEVLQTCEAYGVRMMGPNCVGLINTHHKMNATFAPFMPPPGGISVISQSGALCVALLDWAQSLKLGMAKIVSIGNKADLDEVDFLNALAEDDETKVVAGYLESITDGDSFLRAAENAAGRKPVVIMKAGTTAAGAQAASSHTGSLAGADIAYGAAFRRSGVIRAESLGHALRLRHGLCHATPPQGAADHRDHQRRRTRHHGRRRGGEPGPPDGGPVRCRPRRGWPRSSPPPPPWAIRWT